MHFLQNVSTSAASQITHVEAFPHEAICATIGFTERHLQLCFRASENGTEVSADQETRCDPQSELNISAKPRGEIRCISKSRPLQEPTTLSEAARTLRPTPGTALSRKPDCFSLTRLR